MPAEPSQEKTEARIQLTGGYQTVPPWVLSIWLGHSIKGLRCAPLLRTPLRAALDLSPDRLAGPDLFFTQPPHFDTLTRPSSRKIESVTDWGVRHEVAYIFVATE
jgi:hypothetical protein